MKKTALYDEHVRLGGKMVDFGGFLLPVQYSGITAEHEAVRTHAGIFDVSHMGEFFISGQDAEAFMQHVATNDISKLKAGRAMYTMLCREDGGILDDVLIYRLRESLPQADNADDGETFMMVPNAGNIDKDWVWLESQRAAFPNLQLRNASEEMGLFAVQGPMAETYMKQLVSPEALSAIRFYGVNSDQDLKINGSRVVISRTGYTGEDGFEIYHDNGDSNAIWSALMALTFDGKALLPAGLGARDSLRLEAGLPLYGNELTEDVNPLETGLQRFVKLDKDDFVGLNALKAVSVAGPARTLVGLETVGRGIPRHGYEVFYQDELIGELTSGGPAPTLGVGIGFALINRLDLEEGTIVEVKIRNRMVEHKIVATPFYQRPKN